MFWTIVWLAVGWMIGRNWDQVKKFATDKLNASQSTEGKATKLDQD